MNDLNFTVTPEMKESIERFNQAAIKVWENLVEAIKRVIREIQKFTRKFIESLYKAASPKLYHIYKYSKSHRIRNKNRKRMLLMLYGQL